MYDVEYISFFKREKSVITLVILGSQLRRIYRAKRISGEPNFGRNDRGAYSKHLIMGSRAGFIRIG